MNWKTKNYLSKFREEKICKIEEKDTKFSFKHLFRMQETFNKIKGLIGIDFFSIYVFEENSIIYLSSHPALEHSIISNDLYKHDLSFNPMFLKKEINLFWWDTLFLEEKKNILIKHKLDRFQLKKGLSLLKFYSANISIVYNFGTKKKSENTSIKYESNIELLTKIGDFCFKHLYQLFPKNIRGDLVKILSEKHFPKSNVIPFIEEE